MRRVIRRGSNNVAVEQRGHILLWDMEGLVRKLMMCHKADSSSDSRILMPSRGIRKSSL